MLSDNSVPTPAYALLYDNVMCIILLHAGQSTIQADSIQCKRSYNIPLYTQSQLVNIFNCDRMWYNKNNTRTFFRECNQQRSRVVGIISTAVVGREVRILYRKDLKTAQQTIWQYFLENFVPGQSYARDSIKSATVLAATLSILSN